MEVSISEEPSNIIQLWDQDLWGGSFFKFFFSFMWTIFKVFFEFITTLLLFYVLVFWPWGMWDLISLTRDQTHTPALEVKWKLLSCPTLCDPMGCTVHGILQARILERVPFPSPGDIPDQGSNRGLLHFRQILYQQRHKGSPALEGGVLTTGSPGKSLFLHIYDRKQNS